MQRPSVQLRTTNAESCSARRAGAESEVPSEGGGSEQGGNTSYTEGSDHLCASELHCAEEPRATRCAMEFASLLILLHTSICTLSFTNGRARRHVAVPLVCVAVPCIACCGRTTLLQRAPTVGRAKPCSTDGLLERVDVQRAVVACSRLRDR